MPALITRLAPSPTGLLHVGHAWSFLIAWWHARSRRGRVLLRIEDLDATRVRPGMIEGTLADLAWLGLDWDEEPLLQSTGDGAYREALATLDTAGHIYPCICSRREIQAALSAPHGGELVYPGTCRDRFASASEAEVETGRTPGLRFRVPRGSTTIEDGLLGPLTQDVASEVGDFLLARRDGQWAYQLAVVVDDARQGITDVVRGADLFESTPRQALLQRALGLPTPTWIHVPLVIGDDGERLAKRKGSLALAALREAGADPRELVAWVARQAGQTEARPALPPTFVQDFRLDRLPTTPIRFGSAELGSLGIA